MQTDYAKKNALSPFSTLCGYKIDTYSVPKKNNNLILSEQEQVAVKIIETLNTIVSFQFEDLIWTKNTTRRKLKMLSVYGVLNKYKFVGDYVLNVYALKKITDIDKTLRTLALNQIFIKMLKIYPAQILKAEMPLSAYIKFKEITFPVMVVRSSDNIKALPYIIKSLDTSKLIIISEEFYPEFKLLNAQVRITTDRDLIEKNLTDAFRLPSGKEDKAEIFKLS